MDKKYLLLSLEDKRLKQVSEILGNKTSKRIIDFLSSKGEASEKDISEKLGIPINTAEYNIRKMIQAGIVEETKNFFWSPKGRKIKMYRFANKSIVISPKSTKLSSEIKQIIPVAIISGFVSLGLKKYFDMKTSQDEVQMFALEKTAEAGNNFINSPEYYLWFLAGAFFALALMIAIKFALNEKS